MVEITPLDPNRLKMIWQSSGKDRSKYVVGEIVRAGDQVSLSYSRYTDDFINAVTSGFVGHPAFPMSVAVHHRNVLEVFNRRLPPRSRGDFLTYLAKNRLRYTDGLSDLALLGYTGAYLPSDGFSFAVDWRYQEIPFLYLMEISGFRYHGGMKLEISDLVGKPVSFTPEPNNPHDPLAIRVSIDGVQIGYVPRYYRHEFQLWLTLCDVYGHVERIDGALINPKVHLFVSVSQSKAASKPASSLARQSSWRDKV